MESQSSRKISDSGELAMRKIVFTGWKVGFKTVSMIQLLRSKLGLSLSESKKYVDAIMVEEEVCIEVSSHSLAESVLAEARELGAIGRIDTLS